VTDQRAWVCAFCGYYDKTEYLEDPALRHREIQAGRVKAVATARRNEEQKDWPLHRAIVFIQANAFTIALIGILILLVIGGILVVLQTFES
jgi:hypothetical protein